MRVRVFSIGRVKQDFVLKGEQEYLKRLRPYATVELLELPSAPSSLSEESAKKEEAELFLTKIKKDEFLIVLDERGKDYTSPGLAELLERESTMGRSSFVFAIGGAHGWHESVRQRANIVLSLSRLTFPYQMVRLILTEQIYRAMTLIKGIPYHKA